LKKSLEVTRVFVPTSLKELHTLITQYPNALFFAGGTNLMPNKDSLPPYLISLNEIKELLKIRRKEGFLEIGSAVTLSRILSLGSNVIPKALYTAFLAGVTPAIRNLATIGGNICTASYISDLIVPLVLFDTRVEVRGISGIHWFPILRFIQGQGKTILRPGEVLSLIRIPLEEWDIENFIKLDVISSPRLSVLKCAAAVRINKNSINDLRMAFGGINPLVIRSRELEGILIGNKLPLQSKSIDFFCSELQKLFAAEGDSFLPHPHHQESALRFARHFLFSLNTTSS
jgi:CO/xanthine dehydrogenase FAD-binding subunit